MVTSEEKEGGWGKMGVGDQEIQTTTYKINKLQEYIVQNREIWPLFCNNFKWSIIYKNIEPLHLHLKLIQYYKPIILQQQQQKKISRSVNYLPK